MNPQLNPLIPESTVFETFLIRREKPITVLVTLCGVLAILIGVGWCLMKRDLLLYSCIALSLGYLIGQKYWKFRTQDHAQERAKRSYNEVSVEGVDR